jgi:hypothetical protein
MGNKILSSISLVITIFTSAFIIQDGYAQHDENTSEVTSQFKNAKISSDGIGVIIAVIAACIAAIGLFFNFLQMKKNAKVYQAQFWLSFREFLSKYDEIHKNLRGGEWSSGNTGPSTPDEWAEVEAYMGVFEHANIMLDKKLIDLGTFKEIYKYRISNILSNKRIKEAKLRDKAGDWRNFINLCRKLGLENELPSLAGK